MSNEDKNKKKDRRSLAASVQDTSDNIYELRQIAEGEDDKEIEEDKNNDNSD